MGTKHLVGMEARYNGTMRQFLISIPLVLALVVGATPAYAANLPLFDSNFSIVPTECTSCPCGVGGALQFVQNLMNAAISLGIVVFVFVIVYAGFMFILTPTNPESHSQAKKIFSNAVIGFVIILAAWLIVDFVMKLIYNGGENGFLPWNEILSSDGSQCILAQNLGTIDGLPGVFGAIVNDGIGASPGTGGGGGTGGTIGVAKGLCSDRNTACSPAVMKAEGLSDAQANAMSCIAVTESGGDPNTPDSSTGACGLFQITNRPGNWSVPKYHRSPCSTSTSCNNVVCNRQTAVIMFREQGYQPWTGVNPKTGQHWNPNAVACVNKYDPRR